MLAALPEFLIASVLATVIGVQWGWLPAVGWYGPQWTVLPALALGLPAGAVLGRLLDDQLPGAFDEPWALAAAARGLPGRAVAQDLPVLQAGTLLLVLLGAVTTAAARLTARRLIGPALRDGALRSLHRPTPPPPPTVRRILPLAYGLLLSGVVALGLPRDPLALDTAARLQAPSLTHPFGTDALGRDLLARVAHGALDTLLLALAISALAWLAGVLLGCLPALSAPLVDTVNAVPPVLAALLATALWGSGAGTPVLAVAVVAWAPLAAHTSALLGQERATLHVTATRALGARRSYLLRSELLPAVLPSVTRHAVLRLPGIALALASLSFLGLGAQPPTPEWGLLLAENQPYAERAPWAVLAPAAVLALLGALAVTTAGAGAAGRGRDGVRGRQLARKRPRPKPSC
jgi:peptide/nickel transport system permease protein